MSRSRRWNMYRSGFGVIVILLVGILVGCAGPRVATPAPAASSTRAVPTAPSSAQPSPQLPAEVPATVMIATSTATFETSTEEPATPPPSPLLSAETPTGAPATPLPALDEVALSLLPVAEGLDRPLFVTHAGDESGRLFILEKAGTVRILAGGRTGGAAVSRYP